MESEFLDLYLHGGIKKSTTTTTSTTSTCRDKQYLAPSSSFAPLTRTNPPSIESRKSYRSVSPYCDRHKHAISRGCSWSGVSQIAFRFSSGNDVCLATDSHALNQICLEHSECVRAELEDSVSGPQESVQTEAIEPERHVEHRSGGAPGSGARSRTRETEPMPTPSNLFVSPKGSAQSPYTPGSITPSRGNDRMAARERCLESSVERSSKVYIIYSGSSHCFATIATLSRSIQLLLISSLLNSV